MKLKPGDKVRFLNESVEGEVLRLLPKDRVEVTDGFGFTHIADEKLLVKVEFDHNADIQLPPASINPVSTEQVKQTTTSARDLSHKIPNIISALEADETIYAAVRMHDEKSPLSTDIDLLVVNNTSYSLVFSVSRVINDIRFGMDAGILKPRSEHFIGAFSQDELHRFMGFEFQVIFFGEKEYHPRPPAVKKLLITSSDFLENEYRSRMKGFDESILLMPLYFFNPEQDVDLSKLLEKYQQIETEENIRLAARAEKDKVRTDKYVGISRQKVVDLHIEELLKDFSGMSNAQIISYQVNYFLYEMDQAVVNHVNKITFIHGVGQGVLKSAIREELKKYPNVRYQDAPPEKFGYGATEIELL